MESFFVLGAFADIVSGLLYTIFTLSAIFLVFIILMQEGKGGGLGEAFGGAGAETFGPRVGGINKFTATIALVFVVSTLGIHRLNRPASFDEPKSEIVALTQAPPASDNGTSTPNPDMPPNMGDSMFNPDRNTAPTTSVSDTDLTRSALEAFVPAGQATAPAPESGALTPGETGTEPGTGAGEGTNPEGTGGETTTPPTAPADPFAGFGNVGPGLFEKAAEPATEGKSDDASTGQDG